MATTYANWVDGLQTPELLANEAVKVENVIDLAVVPTTAASDVVQAINVPAGAFVSRVGVLILTKEGGALTATVGDEDDPNGWDGSTNLNATAGTMTVNDLDSGTDAYGEGRYYPSADTIDLVVSGAGATAKFMVWAYMELMENRA